MKLHEFYHKYANIPLKERDVSCVIAGHWWSLNQAYDHLHNHEMSKEEEKLILEDVEKYLPNK